MDRKIIEVVAGVLLQPNGDFLLGSRPQGKPYAGYWEFPGGKVEPGETLLQALAREFQEEMGIELISASYWQTRVHHYEHASVRLRFFLVREWKGEPRALENQSFAWVHPGDASVGPMLPANGPILKALTLPSQLALTDATRLGVDEILQRLTQPEAPAVVLVHEPMMDRETLARFTLHVCERVHAYGGLVWLAAEPELAGTLPVDGVHLPQARLMTLSQRPDLPWVGAFVSDAASLAQAGELALDYALLGPVFSSVAATESLGWAGFSRVQQHGAGVPLPVFACGELSTSDCAVAQQHGAQGIALQADAWR
jgi:8-oxo-dGTP diphosphatase